MDRSRARNWAVDCLEHAVADRGLEALFPWIRGHLHGVVDRRTLRAVLDEVEGPSRLRHAVRCIFQAVRLSNTADVITVATATASAARGLVEQVAPRRRRREMARSEVRWQFVRLVRYCIEDLSV